MAELIAFLVYVQYIVDRAREIVINNNSTLINHGTKQRKILNNMKKIRNRQLIQALDSQLHIANKIIIDSLNKLPEKGEIRYNPYFQVVRKLPFHIVKSFIINNDTLSYIERFALLYAKYHASKTQFKEILTNPIGNRQFPNITYWQKFLADVYGKSYYSNININNYYAYFKADHFIDFAIYHLSKKLKISGVMKIPNTNIQNANNIINVPVNNVSNIYKGLLEKLVVKNHMNLTQKYNFVHLLSNTEIYVFLKSRKQFNTSQLHKSLSRKRLIELYHSYISQNLGKYMRK